jgi:hypothetical protein
MNTQQITRTILRALHEQIDPTVDEMEAPADTEVDAAALVREFVKKWEARKGE